MKRLDYTGHHSINVNDQGDVCIEDEEINGPLAAEDERSEKQQKIAHLTRMLEKERAEGQRKDKLLAEAMERLAEQASIVDQISREKAALETRLFFQELQKQRSSQQSVVVAASPPLAECRGSPTPLPEPAPSVTEMEGHINNTTRPVATATASLRFSLALPPFLPSWVGPSYNHILSTNPIKFPINFSHHYTLSTHPINAFYQYIL